MKKLFGFIIGLTIIAAIMAGIGVGAFHWSGSLAKESFEKSIMLTTGDQAITYNVVNFNKDLFISTAEAKLTIDPEKLNSGVNTQVIPIDKPISVKLKHTIYHGPFAFKAPEFDPTKPVAAFINTKVIIDSNPELKALTTALWGSQNPFKINSTVSFSGLVETALEIAPIDTTTPKGLTVKWTGAKSMVAHNIETNSFSSAMDAGGITFEEGKEWALIDGIKIQASGSFGEGNLLNSSFGYTVEKAVLEAEKRGKLIKGDLKNIAIKAGNKVEGKELSSFLSISLDNLNFDGQKYGPGEINLGLNKIDAEAAISMQKQLEAAKADAAKQGLPPETAMFIAQQKLMENLPKLLQQGPEIEISKLEVQTPQGKVKGQSKIALNLGGKPVPANPMEMIPMISINTNISVPTALVESTLATLAKKDIKRDLRMSGEPVTPEKVNEMANNMVKSQIEAIAAQNLIKIEGESITGSYRMKQGRVNINGIEIPIEQFIGSLMQGQAPK